MAFLSARELKIYLFIVAVLSIAAIVVTLIFMSVRDRSSASRPRELESAGEEYSSSSMAPIDHSRDVLQNIKVPEKYKKLYEKKWKPFRPQYERWTGEMMQPYWIEPEELVKEELEKQSDREIAEFFEKIP